jgi:uncharacterized protein YjbI with pentapeptide repeats
MQLDQEDLIHHQRLLLQQHRRTLLHLLRQQSQQGGEALAALAVVAGIAEAREAIVRIKAILRNYNGDVDDHPDDERRTPNWPAIFPGLNQLPRKPHHYITRKDSGDLTVEDALHQALLNSDGQPLTVVYGMSGTGKSTLVAHVVRQFSLDDFADGILWGDLANSAPNDQLMMFLDQLAPASATQNLRRDAPLRDLCWKRLADKRVLIVLDNVKDARQLIELLPPDPQLAGRCRIVALSIQPLHDALLPIGCVIHLNPFKEQEALELFQYYLGDDQYRIYKPSLRKISMHLEYLPQLLVAAAHDFTSGRISPNSYIQMLQRHDGRNILLGSAAMEGLELAFHDLPPEQMELIELIGIFGEGDWRDTMLAAIALRPLADVRQILSLLVIRTLIQTAGNQRYRVNTLVREYAQRLFNRQSDFRRQAAYTLLAHYCLDVAQDLEATLLSQPDLRPSPGQMVDRANEPFIRAFRSGLLPEMSHIREALRWAVEREAWELLRRFSYLPYLELLKHYQATGFEICMSLRLATLFEPVVRRADTLARLRIGSLIASSEWSLRTSADDGKAQQQSGDITNFKLDAPNEGAPNCEFELDIIAGHIIDGVFQSMSLVDARWIAVRAPGLICCDTDIVGSKLLGCDLAQSVWLRCDARRMTLQSSNLSYALLRHVKLRGADMQGTILTGTILEHVDLRDADLRGANFIGATLDQVDLRGADLRGATLAAANIKHVNLVGCRLDGVRWAGARLHDICIFVEDPSFLREISLAAQIKPDETFERVHPPPREVQDLIDWTTMPHEEDDRFSWSTSGGHDGPSVAPKADLRGAPLARLSLQRAKLATTDMRAACCQATKLTDANLAQTDLRGADLQDADLSGAILREANLKSANLGHAILVRADLSNANLRLAYVSGARLAEIELTGADLTGAVLGSADLTLASLRSTQLVDTILTHAILARADFQRAQLTNTNLQHADLTTCLEADLSHTTLTSAQLSGNFSNTTFAESIMTDAVLSGEFVKVDLTHADLSGAQLSGIFSNVDLTWANLHKARINGIFSYAVLHNADLTEADLRDAILVNADLTGADVQLEQLQAAQRLRGAYLPGGGLYDGSLALPGDLAEAAEAGYNLDDPEDRKLFYKRGRLRFRQRP